MLYYASDKLRNDREIVMESLKNDGCELCYASDKLKNDKEVVIKAV